MVGLAGTTRSIGVHRSDKPLRELINNKLIEFTQNSNGRYDIPQHEVARLAAIAAKKTYVCGKDNVDFKRPYAFAAPINDPKLGAELSLSAHNSRREAIGGFQNNFGITIRPGQSVTGWWAIDDDIAKDLAENKGIILGVVGGLVIEAARIVSSDFYTNPEDNRKVFIIEILNEAMTQQYIGYVPRMNNTGTYVQL